MINTDFLNGLERFSLIVRKKVTSSYTGPRKSMAQGRGMLFKDHRQYAPGDDFRAIDWRVYARTDDLMVKNYEEDRNLVVHVLVDKSVSMHFGKPSKFDYAAMIGVGNAYIAMRRNDKLQFATFSDDIEVYQPRRGLSQVMAMIDYLNSIKPKGKTDILAVAKKYSKYIGSKSLVILISDFLVPFEQVRDALLYLRGNAANIIQVLDPLEKNLDFEGDYKLKDSESDSLMRTYVSPKLREEYKQRMERHIDQIEHECTMLGLNYFQAISNEPIFDVFYRIFK